MSELQLRRRILGIDLGRARIGVAVSDELGMLAHPLETIRRARMRPFASRSSAGKKTRNG
jgi:Predicted endonuclease involved in recombination (possible Holliday junction resolvase in Mycoplasmas and B. subtilis)